MVGKLSQTPEYKETFLSAQDAIILADPRTLLVVVDTNRPEQVMSQDLLECCTRGGRHRPPSAGRLLYLNAALNFHEPYASSASELVTELLNTSLEPIDLLKIEAGGHFSRNCAGHQKLHHAYWYPYLPGGGVSPPLRGRHRRCEEALPERSERRDCPL